VRSSALCVCRGLRIYIREALELLRTLQRRHGWIVSPQTKGSRVRSLRSSLSGCATRSALESPTQRQCGGTVWPLTKETRTHREKLLDVPSDYFLPP
jgi:hypothetical protein